MTYIIAAALVVIAVCLFVKMENEAPGAVGALLFMVVAGTLTVGVLGSAVIFVIYLVRSGV